MCGKHGADFATKRSLGVERDIACVHLQQVGLEDVAGLAGARRTDDEHIVVETGLARAAREHVALRKDGRGGGVQCRVEVRHVRSP